jgi:hypothetical protein
MQLKCKLNEKKMGVSGLVDKIIFEDSKDQTIEIHVLEKKLDKFMHYSYKEDIAEFSKYLTQGKPNVGKQQLSSLLNTNIKFIKFDDSSEKKLKVKSTIEKYKETFDTAIEMEEDHHNRFDLVGLKEALKNTDIEFSEEQFDYLVWILYKQTKDVRKLKRFGTGNPRNNDSLSSIKEEKYSKNESNIDKFSPKKSDKKEDSEYSDDEEKESQNEASEKSVKIIQNDENLTNLNKELNDKQILEMGKLKMNNLAENIFLRISQEMLKRNLTATSLLKDDIEIINFEKSDVEVVEVDSFIESLTSLGIQDLDDLEIKCLMNVLTKEPLERYIKMDDLRSLLENFGVKEYDKAQDQSNEAGMTETDDPRSRKK